MTKQDIKIIEINPDHQNYDQSGGAVPDYQALARGGFVKLNPETGLPDSPVNPGTVVIRRFKNPDGTTKDRFGYEGGGHVKAIDSVWRVGLTPELYNSYLEEEQSLRERGRREFIAPVLTEDEYEDFKKWLKENKDVDIDKDEIELQDVAKEVKKKKASKKEKKVKDKKEEPATEVKKEKKVKASTGFEAPPPTLKTDA